MKPYKVINLLARLSNKWISLVGERVQDENGELLDYWRVERADSVIVIPVINDTIILPKPVYRHGAGETTYDFPGGRINDQETPLQAAFRILEKELSIKSCDVKDIHPINQNGWLVDSSFSNQNVFAFNADLQKSTILDRDLIRLQEPTNRQGVLKILELLVCIQCRHALLEWVLNGSCRVFNHEGP